MHLNQSFNIAPKTTGIEDIYRTLTAIPFLSRGKQLFEEFFYYKHTRKTLPSFHSMRIYNSWFAVNQLIGAVFTWNYFLFLLQESESMSGSHCSLPDLLHSIKKSTKICINRQLFLSSTTIKDDNSWPCKDNQGIINCKGTETFAKEPKLTKLLRKLKLTLVSYNKKSPLVFVACL